MRNSNNFHDVFFSGIINIFSCLGALVYVKQLLELDKLIVRVNMLVYISF